MGHQRNKPITFAEIGRLNRDVDTLLRKLGYRMSLSVKKRKRSSSPEYQVQCTVPSGGWHPYSEWLSNREAYQFLKGLEYGILIGTDRRHEV